MSQYEKGQIWVDNGSKEEFVLFTVGGSPFQPKGFTNHLLVKIGKNGKLLKAKGDNVLVVGHEKLIEPRYSLKGMYPTLKEDFSWR
jgi:hypothetical protein